MPKITSKQSTKPTPTKGVAKAIVLRKRKPQQARTPGTIINSLMKAAPVAVTSDKPLAKYLHCRMDPFTASGGTAIPDGSNANFMVSDARSADTISLAAGTKDFVIQTFPMLPYMAAITSTSTTAGPALTVNGGPVWGSSSYDPSALSSASSLRYYPLSKVPAYLQGGQFVAPQLKYNDPYTSSSARLVSVGYRLTYTGPVTTCAGSITVTPNSTSLNLNAYNTSVAASTTTPGQVSIGARNITSASITYAPIGTPIATADLRISSTALTRESCVFRPEQSIVILPRHRTRDYKLKSTAVTPYVIGFSDIGSSSSTAEFISLFTASTPTTSDYAVMWADDDWEGVTIVASGLNADASFRWDTVACFEYVPLINSVFAEMTIKSSPNDAKAMEAVNKHISSRPVATLA